MSVAGWSALLAAGLTVLGFVTIVAFFATTIPILGTINDWVALLLALATVPVGLALRPAAAVGSSVIATAAVAVDLLGVALAASGTFMLVVGVGTFAGTLSPITIGNALIGAWVAVTAVLLLLGGTVPAPLGWVGLVGGIGLVVSSGFFPLLGQDHPVVAIAGLAAVAGLTAFYAWVGVLLLRSELPA